MSLTLGVSFIDVYNLWNISLASLHFEIFQIDCCTPSRWRTLYFYTDEFEIKWKGITQNFRLRFENLVKEVTIPIFDRYGGIMTWTRNTFLSVILYCCDSLSCSLSVLFTRWSVSLDCSVFIWKVNPNSLHPLKKSSCNLLLCMYFET